MNSDKLTLKIITPQGVLLERDGLLSVNLPLGNQFPIGIRPGHAPLIAETAQGIIKFRSSEVEDQIEIYAGVLKIRNNLITILTSGKVNQEKDDSVPKEMVTYERLMKTLIGETTIRNK